MQNLGRSRIRRACERGFTRTELLSLIATLALLGAVLFPAVAGSGERSQRAACLNNLRQISVAMTIYAANNEGRVVRATQASMQIALDPPDETAAPLVGLVSGSESLSMWTCPNRPNLPVYEAIYHRWMIGYQYFGGIHTWRNPVGSFPSRSPVNLSQAAPHWTLAADPIMRIDGIWGGGRPPTFENMPQHRTHDSPAPQGGNQVFVDGSAHWIQFENMFFLHSWNVQSRVAYFYQDPKDFPAGLARPRFLDALRPR